MIQYVLGQTKNNVSSGVKDVTVTLGKLKVIITGVSGFAKVNTGAGLASNTFPSIYTVSEAVST
jgi:hypothetical protein